MLAHTALYQLDFRMIAAFTAFEYRQMPALYIKRLLASHLPL
jgi:hypothetical protein